MRTLDISTRLLSEVVWKRLLESAAHRLLEKRQDFFQLMASLETLRQRADYATGSITTASAWALYCLAHYFAPQRMLEVGTFIGKSALALALGRNSNFLPSHLLIYPCAEPLLQKFGFADHSTVALLIPQAALRLTAQ